MLKKSLRAQILSLLGGSLALILITALACFSFLSAGLQSYRGLLEGPMHTSRLIDTANLEFKVQVQEWKNVLLRGKDSANLDRYWGQFEAQERKVQNILGELSQSASDPTLKARSSACAANIRVSVTTTARGVMPLSLLAPILRSVTKQCVVSTAPPANR